MAIEVPPPGHMRGPELLRAAYRGHIDRLDALLHQEELRTLSDPKTGLNLLHIAVGTNNLPLTRFLVEEIGIPFGPDAQGRWPTVVAAECGVSEAVNDYIVEKESAYINSQGGSFFGQGQPDQSGPQQPGSFFSKD